MFSGKQSLRKSQVTTVTTVRDDRSGIVTTLPVKFCTNLADSR